jgi:uncharacterized damage-inducible protein DinB
METLETIRRLWEHAVWADEKLVQALDRSDGLPTNFVTELAHIVGAHELWLARLEKRTPRAEVWPDDSLDQIVGLFNETRESYADYLASLTTEALDTKVAYTNSAGQDFESSVGDILVHVALHGQYHRGKVNLMLRTAGLEPAPTDYIAFVRGAPAATRKRRG